MEKFLGLFFCEFDNKYGPKVTYQYPKPIISDESFDTFSWYFIVRQSLADKLIGVGLEDHSNKGRNSHWCIGVPQCLEGSHYPRSWLLWNIVFVFNKYGNLSRKYESVVKKLARYVRHLEKHRGFVFEWMAAGHVGMVDAVLRRVFDSLKSRGECRVPLDYTGGTIEMYLRSSLPSQLNENGVENPGSLFIVWLVDPCKILKWNGYRQWDMSARFLIEKCCDQECGRSLLTVDRLAATLHMSESVVHQIAKALEASGAVALLKSPCNESTISLDSQWCLCSAFKQNLLLDDNDSQCIMMEEIARFSRENMEQYNENKVDLLKFLGSLRRGVILRDALSEHKELWRKVDVVRVLLYCQKKKYIEPV